MTFSFGKLEKVDPSYDAVTHSFADVED
uniref:Uncharacterized protein n=1 Tax=Tetranychus urticae TaxID=32264 RepID=T1L4A6_TETUR